MSKTAVIEPSTGPRASKAWEQTGFVLPTGVVSKGDIARLIREFEALDNALTTSKVRKKVGAKEADAPVLSGQLGAFIDANPVELDSTSARTRYIRQLRVLKDTAPIIHMTFASVVDSESLQQLIVWLRDSIHPQTVIDVHLQPALVAGVYVRTPNHVHDFSVRGALAGRRDALKEALGAPRGNK